MNRGDASALLIVPIGFDNAIVYGRPAELQLVTNPEQEFIPLIVRELAGTLVDRAFYVQRSVPGGNLLGVAPALLGFNGYFNRPLVTVAETAPSRSGPARTVSQMLFPGSMFLVALMLGSGMSLEIWKERAAGSVRRLATTGSGIFPFVAGRAAAMMLVYLAAVGLPFLGERFVIGVPMQMPITAWLWTAGCGLALHLGMVCAQLAAGREQTAITVANGVMLPLAILGGSFFPLDIMPARIAAIGRLTPNGWASQQLNSIVGGTLAPAAVAWRFAGLAAAVLCILMLLAWLLRRRMVSA
jgi:ABC-type multidrug transport system permease subunit